MPMNVKRGFNRLYVVLAVVWAMFCLVYVPRQEKLDAGERYLKLRDICYKYSPGTERDGCFKEMEAFYKGELADVSKFYWRLVLIVVISVPAGYGLALVGWWVWRGFQKPA